MHGRSTGLDCNIACLCSLLYKALQSNAIILVRVIGSDWITAPVSDILIDVLNPVWPRDALWWKQNESALVKVKVCCRHLQGQCGLIISWVQRNALECNGAENTPLSHHYDWFENYIFTFKATSPGENPHKFGEEYVFCGITLSDKCPLSVWKMF